MGLHSWVMAVVFNSMGGWLMSLGYDGWVMVVVYTSSDKGGDHDNKEEMMMD